MPQPLIRQGSSVEPPGAKGRFSPPRHAWFLEKESGWATGGHLRFIGAPPLTAAMPGGTATLSAKKTVRAAYGKRSDRYVKLVAWGIAVMPALPLPVSLSLQTLMHRVVG